MHRISATVAVLRRFRELAGFSQAVMSKKTGISQRTIERIETGRREMNVSEMELYLDALNISYIDVLIAKSSANYHVNHDIAALARLLPADFQKTHLQYLHQLTSMLKKKGAA